MACIDWSPFYVYTDDELLNIKMKLNSTFDSILTELNSISFESRQYIELRLQDHVVSLAEQQRKIARMHRQLYVVNELRDKPRVIYSYEKLIFMILFGLLIGVLYERLRSFSNSSLGRF